MLKQSIDIRDEFHFSVVHRSMNAMGPVQSSGVIYLHETYCVHTSNEIYFLNIYIATDFP